MRRSPWSRGSLAVPALALLTLFAARDATGASRDRRFFSARLGLGIEAPNGWTLSLHTGYPEILCVLLHPDGSRISLSAAPTKVADAKALAEQSRRGLESQHLTITHVGAGPRGGVLLEARGEAHATEVRQLYLARAAGPGKVQGVVLTLSTRTETLAGATAAFEWSIAHLALESPAGAHEADDEAADEAANKASAARARGAAPDAGKSLAGARATAPDAGRSDARVSP